MAIIRIIHVRLLNESIRVWRPIVGARQDQDIFRIVEQDVPHGEIWEFVPGQTVFVKTVKREGEEFLGAIRLLDNHEGQ